MGATEIASRVAAFADARGDATVGGVPFHCRLARRGVADHATVVLRAGGTRAQVYVCIAA
ncbi:hypothetical protein D3C83_202620 [compost metagenome]